MTRPATQRFDFTKANFELKNLRVNINLRVFHSRLLQLLKCITNKSDLSGTNFDTDKYEVITVGFQVNDPFDSSTIGALMAEFEGSKRFIVIYDKSFYTPVNAVNKASAVVLTNNTFNLEYPVELKGGEKVISPLRKSIIETLFQIIEPMDVDGYHDGTKDIFVDEGGRITVDTIEAIISSFPPTWEFKLSGFKWDWIYKNKVSSERQRGLYIVGTHNFGKLTFLVTTLSHIPGSAAVYRCAA